MKYKEITRIVDKRQDGPYTWLAVETRDMALAARPGQFVNIRAGEGYDPLLRRPFSIADVDGSILWIMLHAIGKGTELLCRKNIGEELNIIGPLGNEFPEPTTGKKALFVAGGIGIAPFLLFAHRIPGATLAYGARNHTMIPDMRPWEQYCSYELATDDGSQGLKGNVIDLLKKMDLDQYTIYACGPTPMFRALSAYFTTLGDVQAYYSLETYMGCGFGACKGCSVPLPGTEQMQLCCIDGPVFEWDKVEL